MPDGTPPKTPENPIYLPSDERRLIGVASDLVQKCRTTVGMRSSYYRQLAAWTESGKSDGSKSKLNLLYNHIDRLASYLFSPVDLIWGVTNEADVEHKGREVSGSARLVECWKGD